MRIADSKMEAEADEAGEGGVGGCASAATASRFKKIDVKNVTKNHNVSTHH
jgi:hypothetical protein